MADEKYYCGGCGEELDTDEDLCDNCYFDKIRDDEDEWDEDEWDED